MARKKKKKTDGKVKRRNPYALIASWRTGAGYHPNKRNAQRKKACRGKVLSEKE
jgi:ribosomal protein S6E (S10)